MNLLYYDHNKIDFEAIQSVVDYLKERLGEDLLVVPKDMNLIFDCSKTQLLQIRDFIDKALEKEEINEM